MKDKSLTIAHDRLKRLNEQLQTELTECKRAAAAFRESETQFRSLAEQWLVGVVIIEAGQFKYVNPALIRMMGYSRAELLAAPTVLEFVLEDDRLMVREQLRRREEGESHSVNYSFRVRRKDGALLDLEVFGSRVSFEGRPAVMSTVLDLTERKRAEAALRESEKRYRSLFENMLEGYAYCKMLFDHDEPQDFLYIDVNNAFEQLTGLKNVVGKTVREVIPGIKESNPELFEIYGRVALTGKPERFETYIESLGIWLSVAVYSPGKEHFIAVFDNITDRKQAGAALKLFRTLIDRSNDIIEVVDLGTGRFLDVNEKGCLDLGYSREELLALSVVDIDPMLDQSSFTRAAEELRKSGVLLWEGMHRRKNGSTFPVEVNISHIQLDREYAVAVVRDITERKRADIDLREAQGRLQQAVTAGSVGLWDWDLRTNHVYYSPEWKRQIGYADDEISDDFNEWQSRLHPEDLDRALQTFQALPAEPGPNFELEFRFRHKDGSYRHILARGARLLGDDGTPIRLLGSHVDISELRHLQQQFLQAQKMETVGRLAGGVAHDFNNLLTVINGTADLALADLREGDPLRADLQEIHRAGERAASLTRQLLAFSRRQIIKSEVLNLNAVIADMQSMLRRLIGEDIELAFVPGQNVGSVRADRGQIEQVVVNLAVNARDAMPDGGRLILETRDVELDEVHAAEHPSVQPGPHVMLAISDTGIGMDEPTRTRIFEPFFTTKGEGKGTGLGLSTVYGIVKQSGGSIWVYSELGRGTTFKIYLPRVQEVARQGRAARPATMVTGTETILVVEDDGALRDLARRILRTAGYTVLTASNGGEALLLLEGHDGPVHLMLTDVVMPGMSGRDLAARLADIRPQMKVLYTSGYTDDAVLRHGVLNEAVHFIHKPYATAELRRKVREVLETQGGRPTTG